MSNDVRIVQLLEAMLESNRTPEEVCVGDPELLGEVRERWEQMQRVGCQIDALFPSQGPTNRDGAPALFSEFELPQIQGYEVHAVLGRGGMGVVFQARHIKLNRVVALKMLLAGAYAGAQELARFRLESEAVAALRHPTIVQLYDVGELAGQPYFTMEYVEGGSLGQQLARSLPTPRQSAELVATLAVAVQFAHKSGIIHRDLKPGNILLSVDGAPKITDFGLARPIHGRDGFTLSGVRLGTPSYMAPEQALGKNSEIGPAVDIYALGAILYETLTGRPPFNEATALETERKLIAEEPIPPSRIQRGVPRDLETICLKCLNKNPGRRYASAQDVADDLHRFLDGMPIQARPAGAIERAAKWARRRPALASLSCALVLVLFGTGGTAIWLDQQERTRLTETRIAVDAAIEKSYDLGRVERWHEATQALKQAAHRLNATGSAEMLSRFIRAEADLQFAQHLEQTRQSHAAAIRETFAVSPSTYRTALDSYATAFKDAGLAIDGAAEELAALIRSSKLAAQTLAALDEWAFAAYSSNRTSLQKRLLLIAKTADPDPAWRDRFRDASIWRDKKKLLDLATDASNSSTPMEAHQLAICAMLLRKMGAKAESTQLLRKALHHRPGDYWLNWEMGAALHESSKYREATTYFRVVLALRPENIWAMNRLGVVLVESGEYDEGIALMSRVVELDPTSPLFSQNLAVSLNRAGRIDDSVAFCKRQAEVSPNSAGAAFAFGVALSLANRHAEAASKYRRATELDPQYVAAWCNLGMALGSSGQVEETVPAFQKTIALEPTSVLGHHGLGVSMRRLGRYDEAIVEFRWVIRALDAAKVNPGAPLADSNAIYAANCADLAETLCQMGRFAEAHAACHRALALTLLPAPRSNSLGQQADLCKRLVGVESTLAGILAGKAPAPDVSTQLALAEWLYKHKQDPLASVRCYRDAFQQHSADLKSHHRFLAACAAALASAGQGKDVADLDEAAKASLRKQAFTWLKAEHDVWARRHQQESPTAQSMAASTMRRWLNTFELTSVRDSSALTKLTDAERVDWENLWKSVQSLALLDPQPTLGLARAHVGQKQWHQAGEVYAHLIKRSLTTDGEVWFEFAAVQLLSGDADGYRETCRKLLAGPPQAPRIRSYLLARASTLAPNSAADIASVAEVSFDELQRYTPAFWSLTEQGALHYRAGRYQESLPWFERSLQAESRSGAAVLNWLWLALAHHKLNNSDEAMRWLKKATAFLDPLDLGFPSNADAMLLHRHNWLEAHVLRREAESLLSFAPDE